MWCATWWPRWSAVADGDASSWAWIGLGANLGEPVATLRAVLPQLAALGPVRARSSLYRTEPVGGPPDQPDYLNAVVAIEPLEEHAAPTALLARLHAIEAAFGRERRVRWEARVLDLDLLAVGSMVMDGPQITLPHPRMLERRFVLVPLLEVAPEWRDPRSGRRASERLAELPPGSVERLGIDWAAR